MEVKASLDNTLSSKDSQDDPALKIIIIQINLSGACRASSRNRGGPLAKGRAHTRQQGALPGFPPTPALLQRPSCPVAATRLEQWQRPRRPCRPAGSARCTRGAGPADVWRGERAPRARAVTQPPPHTHTPESVPSTATRPVLTRASVPLQLLHPAAGLPLRGRSRSGSPQPTCLRPARPAPYWRESRPAIPPPSRPTRNAHPLAAARPPDFGALRARGKLLLPFGPRVTSGTSLQGVVLKSGEAEVSRTNPHPPNPCLPGAGSRAGAMGCARGLGPCLGEDPT